MLHLFGSKIGSESKWSRSMIMAKIIMRYAFFQIGLKKKIAINSGNKK